MSRFPFLDAPTPIAFAHRGGAAGRPENSLAAFELAVRTGYRYLETDVHATADGVLVAFHDPSLDRVTDRTGRIAELPYSQVSRARIGGTEPIPLLAELLDAFPDARFNIDVKAAPAITPLAAAIRDAKALDRVCIGSFSDARLTRIREELGPDLCTSLGPRAALALRLASFTGGRIGRRFGRYPCVQVPITARGARIVDERFVSTVHELGMQVHVWTINDAAQMRELLDLGVDGLITDEIAALKDVLVARGQWS